jgi:hypothetical protein
MVHDGRIHSFIILIGKMIAAAAAATAAAATAAAATGLSPCT